MSQGGEAGRGLELLQLLGRASFGLRYRDVLRNRCPKWVPMASDSSCFVSSMCSAHLLQQVNSASPDFGHSLGHRLSNRSPPLVSGLVKAKRCPWEPWAAELFAVLSGDPILPDFRVISLPPSLWLAWVPGRCGTSWFTYTADLSPWGSSGFCTSIGFSACSFTAPTRL